LGTAAITIALSEDPYVQCVPEKFVNPSYTVSIDSAPLTKTPEYIKKKVSLGVANQEVCFSFVAISEIRNWLRKKSNATFYNILFPQKPQT
jgi:hypothetical protein